jgi:hypothetical protein
MRINADSERFGEDLGDDQLVEIIREKRAEDTVVAALKELARRKSSRQPDIFREVLDDPERNTAPKMMVVRALGTRPDRRNQELLLRHSDVQNAPLFTEVVRALGQIGDEHALERLEQINGLEDAMTRRTLEFTKALLAHRLRLNKHFIPPPSEADLVEVTNGIRCEASEARPETIRRALDDVREDLPTISLAEEGAVTLAYRSGTLVLVFTDEFHQRRQLETIRERSALPLVILKNSLSLEHYFLDTYFFTQPSGDDEEVTLLGVRPRGELTYAGGIQIGEEGVDFRLKSVGSRYAAAVEVGGRYDPAERSWEFTQAVASTKVAATENTARTPRRAPPSFQ